MAFNVPSERHRYTISNVESQVFTPKREHVRSGDQTQIAGMQRCRVRVDKVCFIMRKDRRLYSFDSELSVVSATIKVCLVQHPPD